MSASGPRSPGPSRRSSIAFVYQETRSALLLRASREDEAAAAAAGIHIVRHRLIAFVISGFLSGIAGVLLAHFLGTVRVETFYLDLTFLIVAMLVIGGMRSLTGAVAGALVIAALTEFLRQTEIGFTVGKTDLAAPAGPRRRHPRAHHARSSSSSGRTASPAAGRSPGRSAGQS